MEIDTIIYDTPMRLIITTFNKLPLIYMEGILENDFWLTRFFLGLSIERS